MTLTPTRDRRMKNWPFPISVLKSGAVVRNVAPPRPKPKRLKRIPPSNLWVQEGLPL